MSWNISQWAPSIIAIISRSSRSIRLKLWLTSRWSIMASHYASPCCGLRYVHTMTHATEYSRIDSHIYSILRQHSLLELIFLFLTWMQRYPWHKVKFGFHKQGTTPGLPRPMVILPQSASHNQHTTSLLNLMQRSDTMGPLHQHSLTKIMTWISNPTRCFMQDSFPHPCHVT